jgi:methylenetetrahydrofolate dehydrogenase (NADP+)/methenyltetrahydrofolate cyclohydrolase
VEGKKLRGAPLADAAITHVTQAVERLRANGLQPTLAVVLVGDDGAAQSYAESKRKMAEKLGITLRLARLNPEASQGEFLEQVSSLSNDDSVHGILIELPLPKNLDANEALARLVPFKDVDGIGPKNMGYLASGAEDCAVLPATPQACIRLAKTRVNLDGARVAVVGRGRTVGRPLALMLVNRSATVTVCHSRTSDLSRVLRECDIVFLAAGRPGLVKGSDLRAGQIVVDAGINFVDGRMTGDLDALSAAPIIDYFSPVPGGVGRLTSVIVFENLLKCIALQRPELAYDR